MSTTAFNLLPGLQCFAGQRRFCVWRGEKKKRADKVIKVPYCGIRRRASSTDKSTWLSYEDALALWHEFSCPRGLEGGVGIFLGDGLAGVDLDTCIDGDGLAPWAATLLEKLGPAVIVEISPSGTGLKLYLRYDPNDFTKLHDALGLMPGTAGGTLWKRNCEGDHAPGIEVYLGLRWFALTGESVGVPSGNLLLTAEVAAIISAYAGSLGGRRKAKSKAVRAPSDSDQPDLGAEEATRRVDAARTVAPTLVAMLRGKEEVPAGCDTSGSGRAYRLIAHLKGLGLSWRDCIPILQGSEDELVQIWTNNKGLSAGGRGVKRTWENAPAVPPSQCMPAIQTSGQGPAPTTLGSAPAEASMRGDPDEKLSQRQRLLETAAATGMVFWHDPDSNAYVTVRRLGRIERYRVNSVQFKRLLRLLYADRWQEPTKRGFMPGSVSDTAMKEALPALEAQSLKGEERAPDVRVIRWQGAIWLDLGDADWRLVKITAEGWEIIDSADVPLVRPAGLRPLPLPRHDPNALTNLDNLLNLSSDTDQNKSTLKLVVAWLVAVLYPDGPYAILAFDGENGSGKSTACRFARRLVDPNKADVRAPPKNEDDLVIAAMSGRIVCIDNLSRLTEELMDAICRLATGTGIGKRQLFTDGEEVIFAAARPPLFNGIPSMLARGDVADRALSATLSSIPDNKRRSEADLWCDFNAAAPGILALLLDGLATALRNLPTLKLDRLPRMADFARLACAAAPAFGWTAEAMLAAIEENRGAAVGTIIEGEPLAPIVQKIAADFGTTGWQGTATTLLAKINESASPEQQRKTGWPRSGAHLSGRLARIAPALRRIGVVVEKSRDGHEGRRNLTVRLATAEEKTASAPSAASANEQNQGVNADAGGDAPPGSVSRSVSTKPLNSKGADGADAADSVSTASRGSTPRRSVWTPDQAKFGAFAVPATAK